MWRGTPVVGRPQGGTPLQVRDGVDGYLADGAEQVAARVVELVADPGLAIEMGAPAASGSGSGSWSRACSRTSCELLAAPSAMI